MQISITKGTVPLDVALRAGLVAAIESICDTRFRDFLMFKKGYASGYEDGATGVARGDVVVHKLGDDYFLFAGKET